MSTEAPLPAPANAQDTSFTDTAARIAAEVVQKFDTPPPPDSSTAGASVPVATAAAPVSPAAGEPATAPDARFEKLFARVVELETQLSQSRVTPSQASEPAPVGIRPEDLRDDFMGSLRKAGIDPQYAARALLATVSPQSLSPDQQALAATQSQYARLEQRLTDLARENSELRSAYQRGEYQAGVRDYVGGVTPDKYPAVAAAYKNDPKRVSSEIMRIAVEDARQKQASNPRATPITPEEATQRLETQFQDSARLMGLTLSTAPKPVPAPSLAVHKPVIVPAASALPGGAPSPASPKQMTWEEYQEQILKEVRQKYDIPPAGTTN